MSRGVHAPMKVDDHGPDALRYVLASLALGRRVTGVRNRAREARRA